MKGFFFLLFLFQVFYVLFPTETQAAKAGNGVYIVYMGSASLTANSYRADLLINSVLKRRGNALVHRYRHGFSGFAARLSAEEAQDIAKKPGVVSVFPDPNIDLHTTRSWDFLRYQTDVKIDSHPYSSSDASSDAIVGILDTGIWPESESFSDRDMGPIPARWKGTCMRGTDFNSSNCNRKIIGARFYKDPDDEEEYNTSRDIVGHGTHVASTIAGTAVDNASYYGLATGTAKGGFPGSRIAVYRVCSPGGCAGSSILAAFDDAISDGVDVLSLSLGAPSWAKIALETDPIAIGAFHAVEQGITVICSAGNDGPDKGTVVNAAPWILTVGASTIDRDFESDVLLGGNKVVKGEGINFANISKSPVNPLIHGKSAKTADGSEDSARQCFLDSLEGDKVKGKIVVCENVDGSNSASSAMDEVKSKGGIGCVFVDDQTRSVANTYGSFPITVISSKDAAEISSYLDSTSNPVATVLPTVTIEKFKPAPAIAYFSSRGPTYITRNILKPDIAAPGVAILAAWTGSDKTHAPEGKKPTLYNVISGTSMATPHVSAIAAAIKSHNPTWGPSAVRSAIMTTAIQTNNARALITTETGEAATPYDYGAGELSPTAPLQPGLVYETTTIDYLNFLCYRGYNITKIKTISKAVPNNFTCPAESNIDLISNINYPSIAISSFNVEGNKTVSRTVTNVGGDGETAYTVSVEAPTGINVQVTPEKLQFTKDGEKLTYQVIISSTAATTSLGDDVFGAITWSNGKYKVRSPLVVSSKSSNTN